MFPLPFLHLPCFLPVCTACVCACVLVRQIEARLRQLEGKVLAGSASASKGKPATPAFDGQRTSGGQVVAAARVSAVLLEGIGLRRGGKRGAGGEGGESDGGDEIQHGHVGIGP